MISNQTRKIKIRQFDWKADNSHQDIGFIADELQELDKRFVTDGGYDEDGTPIYKSIDTLYVCAYLTKAIQQQQKQIEYLQNIILEYEKRDS